MEEKILSVLRSVLEDSTLRADCSQENCENWDSLHHLSLVSELEDEFNVEFEPDEINHMISFIKIKTILETKL